MVSREARSRFRLLPFLMAAAGAAIAIWSPSPSSAAWDGNQDVRLGDQMSAEFKGAPLTEVHRYAFFAPKDTVLNAAVSLAVKTGTLQPELKVFTDFDAPVDLGAAQVGASVKNFKFAATGSYYFQVRATAGTGVYKLATKVKFPKSIVGATTTGSFAFDALGTTIMSAQVKATKGSTAVPKITALTYQGGTVALGAAAGSTKLSKLALPLDRTYTLVIDPTTAGQSVDVKITLAAPKTGRLWNFGFVEDTTGLATQNRTKWEGSGHADHTAMPFNDWNDTNPPAIPTTCARCHSTPGYRDYLGADGTAVGVVNNPAPIGTVVECDACHNDQAAALTSVTFPSGLVVSELGKEARCMVCHQGRESTVSVEAKIATAAPANDDEVKASLTFSNVHYFAAAASLYGRDAAGGYEYAQPNGEPADAVLTTLPQRKPYDRKFTHVASKDTCIECHDPHNLERRIADCATCHVNAAGQPVANDNDLRDIRMAASLNDFDGDGSVTEGLYYEIAGLQGVLYAAIQDYATKVAGTAIEYKGDTYPYFMVAGTTTRYSAWTARLLRAAYNYQFSIKDPGSFAHNGKYIVELLYDSISDLNSKLSTLAVPSPVPNFAGLKRNDPGHFDSSAEPFTDWNQDEAVSSSCVRCHSIEGFQFVVKYGIDQTIPAGLISGFSCETCHVKGTSFAPRAQNPNPDQKPERIYVKSDAFPYPTTATSTQIAAVTIKNGAQGTAAQDDSFICMTCHRARESALTVEAADVGGLTTNFTLSAKTPHYLSAGATLYGSKAAVMYQYTGKTYVQRWDHDSGYNTPYAEASGLPTTPAAAKAQCAYCHMENGSHSFEVELTATCTGCHSGTATIADLAPAFRAQDNFDGDVATKPKAETAAFAARLLTAIQDYAKAAKAAGTTGAEWTIFYNHDNPASTARVGFYKDLDHSGVLELSELVSANANKWDSKGYRATFNYRYWVNEPGAWAHNPKYVLQVFYDAILDLGGDVTGLTRP
jgi:hypothetical protein